MTMQRNALWLDLSAALFRETIPFEIMGILEKLTRDKNAELADREQQKVDAAVVNMALSKGQNEVDDIVATLSKDTLTSLACRWAHHQNQWRGKASDPSFSLWFPPGDRDAWRVIFLSLLPDRQVAACHLRSLWPEDFAGFREVP
jgi:hypothetical protein